MIITLQYLIAPVFSLFLFGSAAKDKKEEIHPTYIAVAQIDFNSNDKFATLLCKTFTDDLDVALQKQFNNKERVPKQGDTKIISQEIENYISGHLQIKINGRPVKFSFTNYKEDAEDNSVGLYFKITNIENISRIEITDTIFYELYDTQIQIIYVTVDGNRKSSNIRNPVSKAAFDF